MGPGPGSRSRSRGGLGRAALGNLWQWPLFLFSIVLFGYAAYLFIDPQRGPTLAERIDHAHGLLRQERPEAALEQLNELLDGEGGELSALQEGAVRMMLGEALAVGQKQKKLDIASNHRRIVEQTRRAIDLGIEADASAHERLAHSYEALGRLSDAAAHYFQLMALDPQTALKWERKVIEMHLRRDDGDAAWAALETYLGREGLSKSERAWALGESARVQVDKGLYGEAKRILDEALKLEASEPSDVGSFNYWMGYCEWKLGNVATAEKHLRVARDLLRTQHPLDADAAYALGKIKQVQHEWASAASFYNAVMQSHLDSRVMPLSKLGRGVCRIALMSHDAGISDLEDLVKNAREREITRKFRAELLTGLRLGSALLGDNGNLGGALELMAYEQEIEPRPAAEFFGRLADLYVRQADEFEDGLGELTDPVERPMREGRLRQARSKAGDAFVAYSLALTLKDDKGYGQALWRGIELYDQAGDLGKVITALEKFVGQRPDDALAPDAYLRLGQSYHAAGFFDRAIGAYRHNQMRYPKSLAASKSGVPLARAYMAKGPDFYRKAEETLRGVIEDNPQITPDAAEFREALFELAHLHYRTGRYELAISRIREITERYPNDERMGQLYFLMGDSYRKSAGVLEGRIAEATTSAATRPALDVAEAKREREKRLLGAREQYDKVIGLWKHAELKRDLDRLYLKLAHFYRADCVYDLGEYVEAIKLYGEAAFRYQDDPSALAAYVQIVNSNVALGRLDEAKAANERAKWMLRRMPAEAFSDGSAARRVVGGLAPGQWEQWLKWSGESGVWK